MRQGGHVVMACRRPDAGEEAARSFAGKHDRPDGLACNAGIANMTGEFGRTKDGLELTTDCIVLPTGAAPMVGKIVTTRLNLIADSENQTLGPKAGVTG